MAKAVKPNEKSSKSHRPALTPEAREAQMIALAVDLAEKQLREGTASSQVISHYLKMGSPKERLERERAAAEVEMIKAKAQAFKSAENVEALYAEAIAQMRVYQGVDNED